MNPLDELGHLERGLGRLLTPIAHFATGARPRLLFVERGDHTERRVWLARSRVDLHIDHTLTAQDALFGRYSIFDAFTALPPLFGDIATGSRPHFRRQQDQ